MTAIATLWIPLVLTLAALLVIGLLADLWAWREARRFDRAQRAHRKATEARKAHVRMFLPNEPKGLSVTR